MFEPLFNKVAGQRFLAPDTSCYPLFQPRQRRWSSQKLKCKLGKCNRDYFYFISDIEIFLHQTKMRIIVLF